MDMVVGLIVVAASAIVYFARGFFWKRPLHIASLEGRHVFITGASSGIGLALAKQALLEGACVTLTGRNSNSLQAAVASLSSEVSDSSHRIEMKVWCIYVLPPIRLSSGPLDLPVLLLEINPLWVQRRWRQSSYQVASETQIYKCTTWIKSSYGQTLSRGSTLIPFINFSTVL